MKKSELRKLIREEIQSLNEGSKSELKDFDKKIKELESNVKEYEGQLKSATSKDEKRTAEAFLDSYKGLLSIFRKKRNELASKIGR